MGIHITYAQFYLDSYGNFKKYRKVHHGPLTPEAYHVWRSNGGKDYEDFVWKRGRGRGVKRGRGSNRGRDRWVPRGRGRGSGLEGGESMEKKSIVPINERINERIGENKIFMLNCIVHM